MRIAATYSFKDGKKKVARRFPQLLVEVNAAIKAVSAAICKTKESTEKTMPGRMLYCPRALNRAFRKAFDAHNGWDPVRVKCEYSDAHYSADEDVPWIVEK